MIAIVETINKAIELARKNGRDKAVAAFYQEHDVMKVLEELAKCGWHASVKRCYDAMQPDLTIIEYEIDL